MKITLKDLAVQHDYYASDSNYYSNDAGEKFEDWEQFYAEYQDADIDYNLVFRWDIFYDEDKSNYSMQLIFIQQRKGKYWPIHINKVSEENTVNIQEFLKPHFNKLCSIWKPIS